MSGGLSASRPRWRRQLKTPRTQTFGAVEQFDFRFATEQSVQSNGCSSNCSRRVTDRVVACRAHAAAAELGGDYNLALPLGLQALPTLRQSNASTYRISWCYNWGKRRRQQISRVAIGWLGLDWQQTIPGDVHVHEDRVLAQPIT